MRGVPRAARHDEELAGFRQLTGLATALELEPCPAREQAHDLVARGMHLPCLPVRIEAEAGHQHPALEALEALLELLPDRRRDGYRGGRQVRIDDDEGRAQVHLRPSSSIRARTALRKIVSSATATGSVKRRGPALPGLT